MTAVQETPREVGNPEAIEARSISYDVVREFVDTNPGLLRTYPGWEKENKRPHERDVNVFAEIQLTPNDCQRLFIPVSFVENYSGLKISFFSPTDHNFPNGMWISIFDPKAKTEHWPMYAKGYAALLPTGEVKKSQLSDSPFLERIQVAADAIVGVLVKAIAENRVKPLESIEDDLLQKIDDYLLQDELSN